MLKNIQAELAKLNYAPIFWLIGGTVVSIVVLIYFAHYNDVESISAIGKNPWIKYWNATVGIFSVFISVPFLVLLISACFFIENNNNTWKYLYVTPNSRASILLSKLFVIVILIFITYLLLVFLTLGSAYLLNFILPEIEIAYYPLKFEIFYKKILITFINSLGIIGIQFFLSLKFRGFLLPATLGIIAFIMALIVGVTNTPVSHYFPYSYPLIGQDLKMFTIDHIGIIDYGSFNSVQIYSVIIFLFFVLAGILSERKRAI